eukprot:JZ548247.1.p3 GENE.JZ548247.1~~JZ548247.1.p3  ORF type:complete len:68 (+),score=22.74 JZ548247.1:296-499(+)
MMRSEVLATGPGFMTAEGKLLPMTVIPGDRVLLPEYGGTTFKVEDAEYIIMREDELMGVFKKEKTSN